MLYGSVVFDFASLFASYLPACLRGCLAVV